MSERSVEVGQLYRDKDPRTRGARYIRVVNIGKTHAACEAWWVRKVSGGGREVGKRRKVAVRLDRFGRDYELVQEGA